MNIYVGNIAWSVSDDQLEELFAQFGTVTSAKIIIDKFSKRSRGFGFVEMADGGEQAIAESVSYTHLTLPTNQCV